jgi:hypothetical protein
MNLNFILKSPEHLRYENGKQVSVPQVGAARAVQVEPNVNGCEGYNIKGGEGFIVTVYNLDGNHPVWNSNVQMTPKPMKVVSQSTDKIVLRGYQLKAMSPFGWIDFNGADYGLSIFLKNGQVDKCTLHMHDRNIDIEYKKGEVEYLVNEPEIVLLAKRANSQYQSNNITDGRQLLIQIYRSIKSNPEQLKDLKDYSSIGTVFLTMLDQNLSDDIDTLQMMASISYLCISKSIENDKENLNFYRDRLLLLRIAHEPFKYTVISALKLNSGGFLSFTMGMSDLTARDAIYKMEIADLELHPVLYRQISIFKERKDKFDAMIDRQFFLPEETLDDVVKSGVENHKRLLFYLENMVINEADVDF